MHYQIFNEFKSIFKHTDNLQAVTDLRIGQTGHGLGPRAFGGPAQLLLMTTQY